MRQSPSECKHDSQTVSGIATSRLVSPPQDRCAKCQTHIQDVHIPALPSHLPPDDPPSKCCKYTRDLASPASSGTNTLRLPFFLSSTAHILRCASTNKGLENISRRLSSPVYRQSLAPRLRQPLALRHRPRRLDPSPVKLSPCIPPPLSRLSVFFPIRTAPSEATECLRSPQCLVRHTLPHSC